METDTILSQHHGDEPRVPQMHWRYDSPGSVYAAEQLPSGRVLCGGSEWERTNVPYTQELARTALGTVYALDPTHKHRSGEIATRPSMANAIVPLYDGRVYVGCKHKTGTHAIFGHEKLNLVQQQDDEVGGGVYNAMYHDAKVIAVTRNGLLQRIDPNSLQITDHLQITPNRNIRAWSMATLEEHIVVGDYKGFVYLIRSNNIEQTLKPEDYIDHGNSVTKYDPSAFGLATIDNGVVVGSRSGQLTWLEVDQNGLLRPIGSRQLPEEITCVQNAKRGLLVGTRSGKVLHVPNDQSVTDLHEIIHISPKLQNDNSPWSISADHGSGHIVCFADGQVVGLDY